MRRISAISLLLLAGFALKAQDVHFSQFMAAPQQVNPAITGLFEGDLRLNAHYRSQWGSITVPYRTLAASGDLQITSGLFENDVVGGGLFIYSDKAGDIDFSTNQINLSFAYHKSLSAYANHYLSVGFVAGIAQRSVNPSKMTFDNQFNGIGFDPDIGIADNIPLGTYFYSDFGAGISWYYGFSEHNKAYVGASAFHLNSPNQSFYEGVDVPLDRKQIVYAGGEIALGYRFALMPQAVVMVQGPLSQVLAGAMFQVDLDPITGNMTQQLAAGLYSRFGDAVIAVIRVNYDQWSAGFSYDINTSKLTSATFGRGGPELHITYLVDIPGFRDTRQRRMSPQFCPKF